MSAYDNNYSSLSALITQFRQLQQRDAITPESLGALLQDIVDFSDASDALESLPSVKLVANNERPVILSSLPDDPSTLEDGYYLVPSQTHTGEDSLAYLIHKVDSVFVKPDLAVGQIISDHHCCCLWQVYRDGSINSLPAVLVRSSDHANYLAVKSEKSRAESQESDIRLSLDDLQSQIDSSRDALALKPFFGFIDNDVAVVRQQSTSQSGKPYFHSDWGRIVWLLDNGQCYASWPEESHWNNTGCILYHAQTRAIYRWDGEAELVELRPLVKDIQAVTLPTGNTAKPIGYANSGYHIVGCDSSYDGSSALKLVYWPEDSSQPVLKEDVVPGHFITDNKNCLWLVTASDSARKFLSVVSADKALANAIASETSRASGIEEKLGQAIADERARACDAEAQIESLASAAQTKAEAALTQVGDARAAISAETSRASGAEAQLAQAIADHDVMLFAGIYDGDDALVDTVTEIAQGPTDGEGATMLKWIPSANAFAYAVHSGGSEIWYTLFAGRKAFHKYGMLYVDYSHGNFSLYLLTRSSTAGGDVTWLLNELKSQSLIDAVDAEQSRALAVEGALAQANSLERDRAMAAEAAREIRFFYGKWQGNVVTDSAIAVGPDFSSGLDANLRWCDSSHCFVYIHNGQAYLRFANASECHSHYCLYVDFSEGMPYRPFVLTGAWNDTNPFCVLSELSSNSLKTSIDDERDRAVAAEAQLADAIADHDVMLFAGIFDADEDLVDTVTEIAQGPAEGEGATLLKWVPSAKAFAYAMPDGASERWYTLFAGREAFHKYGLLYSDYSRGDNTLYLMTRSSSMGGQASWLLNEIRSQSHADAIAQEQSRALSAEAALEAAVADGSVRSFYGMWTGEVDSENDMVAPYGSQVKWCEAQGCFVAKPIGQSSAFTRFAKADAFKSTAGLYLDTSASDGSFVPYRLVKSGSSYSLHQLRSAAAKAELAAEKSRAIAAEQSLRYSLLERGVVFFNGRYERPMSVNTSDWCPDSDLVTEFGSSQLQWSESAHCFVLVKDGFAYAMYAYAKQLNAPNHLFIDLSDGLYTPYVVEGQWAWSDEESPGSSLTLRQTQGAALVEALRAQDIEGECRMADMTISSLKLFHHLYGGSAAQYMMVKLKPGGTYGGNPMCINESTRSAWILSYTTDGSIPSYTSFGEGHDEYLLSVEAIAYRPLLNQATAADTGNQNGMYFTNMVNATSLSCVVGWNLPAANVTVLANTFRNCRSLPYLNLSNWDTSGVSVFDHTFFGCSSLRTVEGLASLSFAAATSVSFLFADCPSLDPGVSLTFDLPRCSGFNGMFYNSCHDWTGSLFLNLGDDDDVVYAQTSMQRMLAMANSGFIDGIQFSGTRHNIVDSSDFAAGLRCNYLNIQSLPGISIHRPVAFSGAVIRYLAVLQGHFNASPNTVDLSYVTGCYADGSDNQWLDALVNWTPHLSDGQTKTLILNASLLQKEWASHYISILQSLGYTIVSGNPS